METNEFEVLIVEDEEKIAATLVEYLKHDGFRTAVLHEGTRAVETIRDRKPDLVILDLMLPGKDGLTICREVREYSNVPIMMLTARIDEIDRLVGLEMGADDYVCKPFLPREVVARVKAILRRTQQTSQSSESEDSLTYRDLLLQPERHRCRVDGQELELTPVEFRMLHAMMAHPGRVFTRDHLMQTAYPDRRIVSDRTIDSHIKNLRKKLNDATSGEELIHSIYGVGYKIE